MHKIPKYILITIPILFMFAFGLSALIPSIFIAWLVYQSFFSDHILYNPKKNYQYNLQSSRKKTIVIQDNTILLEASSKQSTYIIEANVTSSFSGNFLDPYITITSQGNEVKQYFERSVSGKRYLNISSLCNDHGGSLTLNLKISHCTISSSCILHTFDNSRISIDKLMVIAPHADDAEIAAYGLYSRTNSHIITLTAGEIEPETFKHFSNDLEKASKLKGLVRAWDSLAVPLWGNQPYTNSIQLGYFCKQLAKMHDSPDLPVQSLTSPINDTRTFRIFNTKTLTSDQDGKSTWKNLVQDLADLIEQIKPTSIVTPHDQIDAHSDHIFATRALKEALSKTKHQPDHLLLYANHLTTTDMHPYGPAHSNASLPPSFEMTKVNSLFSVPLDKKVQTDKAISLEMMHDLRRPIKFKKKIRAIIQSLIINRKITSYGADPYFRKAVRSNELFFVEPIK
ncbi:PIG-L deacetylase family protein [Endozoicomonas lisbonensis]|uniref:LmbE family N-acetylglucosaminyl deacetylase n=1 Tax=Endozoicomonas lisbonensis TaxID=3120522 RepID=A0ABV2SIJ1_9GAMM